MKSNHAASVYETDTFRVWETEVWLGKDIYGNPQFTYSTESEELIGEKWEHFVALKY